VHNKNAGYRIKSSDIDFVTVATSLSTGFTGLILAAA